FAGYSGKFLIDADHNVHFIPEQDLKMVEIDFTSGYKFRKFIIADPQGNQYTFGSLPELSDDYGIEKTATRGVLHDPPIQEYSSWYLVKMESFDGHHWISLSYTDENYGYKNLASCS